MYGVYVIIMINLIQGARTAFRGSRIVSKLVPSYIRKETNVCRNCIHFLPKEAQEFDAVNKCKKFGYMDIVTRDIFYSNATYERTIGNCGPRGIYYQSRKNTIL